MQVIRLVYLASIRAFYRWALREIDPLHPDVPRLVLRQYELNERTTRLLRRHT